MELVKCIVDMIDEEIEGAENYAKFAVREKNSNPTLSKVFADLASDELRHVDTLHAEVVNLIKRLKEKGTVIPDAMLDLYNWLHLKAVEEVTEIKSILAEVK
jgi:Rubrerythrin.